MTDSSAIKVPVLKESSLLWSYSGYDILGSLNAISMPDQVLVGQSMDSFFSQSAKSSNIQVRITFDFQLPTVVSSQAVHILSVSTDSNIPLDAASISVRFFLCWKLACFFSYSKLL